MIGTVSTDAKAAVARAHGCEHTIVYTREDVATRVRELTDGAGVPVVYDSIGKTTYQSSIDSLARRGLLVCFGTASGPIPPINAMELAVKGSLFVTRPALADYIADPAERAALAGELFDHVGAGRIHVEINQRYALEDAVQAHRDLESGRSIGSSVFELESAPRPPPAPSPSTNHRTKENPTMTQTIDRTRTRPTHRVTRAPSRCTGSPPSSAPSCATSSLAERRERRRVFAELKDLLLQHKVLFFRDQDITRADHVEARRAVRPAGGPPGRSAATRSTPAWSGSTRTSTARPSSTRTPTTATRPGARPRRWVRCCAASRARRSAATRSG